MATSWRSEIQSILALAVPIAGAQLAQIALQVVDNMMCGRLGAEALAGVGLGSATLATLLIPLLGMVGIISAFISESEGQSKASEKPRLFFQQGIYLAFLLGLPALVILSYSPALLRAIGQPEALVSVAEAYLNTVRWCIVPALVLGVFKTALDSLSRPLPGFWVALSGIVFNILANQLLMFGGWGETQWFTPLGVAGTGWATTLTNVWMLSVLGGIILWDRKLRSYGLLRHWQSLSWPVLVQLLRTGGPVGISILSEVGLFAGMTFLMGYISATALAAHQIALNVASLTFMCALGISYATTVRVGGAMGAQEPERAKRAGMIGMGLAMGLMGLAGLGFWCFPMQIIGLYLDLSVPENQGVLTLGSSLLQLAALFQIFDALQVTSQGGLRGLKDTFAPMVIGFFCYWGVGLGVGVVLGFVLNWGARGLWMGFVLGLMSAGVLLALRFFRFFVSAVSAPRNVLS